MRSLCVIIYTRLYWVYAVKGLIYYAFGIDSIVILQYLLLKVIVRVMLFI